ncbi:sulfite exporter TauE/SafE family protein [Rubrobacter indicoceani]|uniref:sulfite exporter TauE/SafE family protein n=1 Tax=Rubrobacter indicoceani TaxID=2051957 RepID=UPI000E5B8FEF|nr:sulfite exporter TauE/SafE family protein [Rubrobacter indicoceani]
MGILEWGLLVALFAAFAAGTISGLTGFGLALISVPLLLFVYEPQTVVLITVFISLVVNISVVRDSRRDADRGIVWAMLLPCLVGVIAGAEILRVVDPLYLRLFIGVFVVFSAVLLLRSIQIPGANTRWGPVLAGGASGALSTATGLAAPPVVLLLASREYAKRPFRGTSGLFFLFLSVFGLAALLLRGLIRPEDAVIATILLPAAMIGKYLGTRLLERISEKSFRLLTLVFTLVTGALGAATAVFALLG